MSQSNQNRKTWIDNAILTSEAWRSVRGVAPHIFMLFLSKRKMAKRNKRVKADWICININELNFTHDEAKKAGYTEKEFLLAIRKLIDRGFLDVVQYGGGVEKNKTVYALSNRWMKYGTDEFVKSVRVKYRRGFCVSKELRNKN